MLCPFFGGIRLIFGASQRTFPTAPSGIVCPSNLAGSERPTRRKVTYNVPQKRPLSYPRRPSSTAVPKIDPRRPRRPPDGLIPGPPGHSRPPHTPWGHCGRLGWPVVTCGGHPQPSRRSRTPFRYGCPRVCGSPAGDSGDLCRHQRDGMGSWGVLQDHHGVQ